MPHRRNTFSRFHPRAGRSRPHGRATTQAVALVAVVALIAGGVFAAVQFAQHDKLPAPPPTTTAPAAAAATFDGTYRADLGPGTDLEDKAVANAPASTASWVVRSTCGAR